MLQQLMRKFLDPDLSTPSGRADVEERYLWLRRQVPVVYLLGFVNLTGMELATSGHLVIGLNLPTLIVACGVLRAFQWFGATSLPTHSEMVRRMRQTVLFAALVCIAVSARCIHLLGAGDDASKMAVMLFGGFTAIGVAYGLTALPVAARIPLVLIIVPLAALSFLSGVGQLAWAGVGLLCVAVLTMTLLGVHNRHLTDLISSRSLIVDQQAVAEGAHREAIVAATTDFLTGLSNRRAFVAAIETEIANEEPDDGFALAIMDLNRFKGINDTFGHETGDILLQQVAGRLLQATEGLGFVARLGGDEFGILLRNVQSASQAEDLGKRILRQVNKSVTIKGRRFEVSASCGLTIGKRLVGTPSRLMADADLALYEAKSAGSNGLALFEAWMEAPLRRRAEIEQALQAPAVLKDLRLDFQPIVNLETGDVLAHEALARWTDGRLGPIAPSEFVPLAEQLNLIDGINTHLLALAFSEAKKWPSEVKLSFNLSAVQLRSPDLAGSILAKLAIAELDPKRLQVEVTETALLLDFEQARDNLAELRNAGVTIVLDDFGAGYASIGYLRELRFDQIKLDGALVTAALDSLDGQRLLRAVIGLCDLLGVTTVAEHIECEDLMTLVQNLGCTAGQGFWLQPPVSAAGLSEIAKVRDKVRRNVRRLTFGRAAA